jgi:hypothetical protein
MFFTGVRKSTLMVFSCQDCQVHAERYLAFVQSHAAIIRPEFG